MSETIDKGHESGSAVAQADAAAPSELYAEGARHLKARDYASARACFEKYLEQNPDDPAALHLLARVLYHQNKDLDKAKEYLEKAAAIDPGSLSGYLQTLGILLIHQGKYDGAREVLERALSEDKKTDARHTAALKFYLDLVKKKGGSARPHHEAPREFFFTAEYGHRKMRAPYFVLPSIIVHALVLILVSYLSTHHMPFKKPKIHTDFTFVQLSQPSGGGQSSGGGGGGNGAGQAAARTSAAQSPAGRPEAGQRATGQPETGQPAPAQPKMAKVEMKNNPATASPEMKQTNNGSPGAVSAKSAAPSIKPGKLAALNAISARKEADIKEISPKIAEGGAEISIKSLTAPSGRAKSSASRKYRMAKLNHKASAMAGGTINMTAGSVGKGGPKWNMGKMAGLREQNFRAAVPMEQAREMAMAPSARSFHPTGDELKSFAARPLGINTGGPAHGANPARFTGVKSLTGMREDISAYERLQGDIGVSVSSQGAGAGSVASKEQANIGQTTSNGQPQTMPGGGRMVASLDRLKARLFASAGAYPGRKTLEMPGAGAANRASGKASRSVKMRTLSMKSTYPAAYASPGISSPGAGSRSVPGGASAGISRETSRNALGRTGSAGGLGGLLESASEKISGMLGISGRPAGPSGPSAGDFRRGGVAGLAAGMGRGTGLGTGSGGNGYGASGSGGSGSGSGVRGGKAGRQSSWVSATGPQKQSSWVAAKSLSGGYGAAQSGGITGGKLFAGNALGTPGGRRYASASRAGVTPLSVGRSSVISRGTLIAENKIGPKVRILSPGSGSTDRISQTITGVVSDKRVRNATLTVNNNSQVISVENGRFEATFSLSGGRNTVTVMAFDSDGNVGKDSINLDYSGSSEGAPVNIIYPKDGQVFDVSENCVITVKGTVGDSDISRAKLILNGNPMDIVVNRGYFEQKVALMEEQNTIQVEAVNSRGQTTHSHVVDVGTVNVKPKDILIILTWDKPHADFDLHVYSPSGGHTYYKQPNIYESKNAIPGGRLEQDAKGNFGPEVFDQEHAERGIYTVRSNYYYSGGDGDAHAKVTIILYGDNPSRRIVRVFGPYLQRDTKDGSDWGPAIKFKMPEGIFLDE